MRSMVCNSIAVKRLKGSRVSKWALTKNPQKLVCTENAKEGSRFRPWNSALWTANPVPLPG